MTQTQMQMATLYARLAEIGLPKSFVREKALPDWWNEEFEATSGAAVEAAVYISRRLNLDITSLLKVDAAPTFKRLCKAKFKTQHGNENQELYVAYCIATRIAEMVACACVPEYKSLPTSGLTVRDEIVKTGSLVDLEGLLEFCWTYGIPVVHFNSFPPSVEHKFDAMVGHFYNHPVVVISSKHHSPSLLLFILAHELGHLAKAHIKDVPIVDEKVEMESIDSEEREANEFAVKLLLGNLDMDGHTPRDFMKTKVTNVLKPVKDDADTSIKIGRYAQKYLDLERLDGDSQDYLELLSVR